MFLLNSDGLSESKTFFKPYPQNAVNFCNSTLSNRITMQLLHYLHGKSSNILRVTLIRDKKSLKECH